MMSVIGTMEEKMKSFGRFTPRPSLPALHRRQVRRLPLLSRIVEVGDLELDLDPLELLAELEPGFLPVEPAPAGISG
jgi:hypothetical protein